MRANQRTAETIERYIYARAGDLVQSPQTELFFYAHQCRIQMPNAIILKDACIETRSRFEDRFQGDVETSQNL